MAQTEKFIRLLRIEMQWKEFLFDVMNLGLLRPLFYLIKYKKICLIENKYIISKLILKKIKETKQNQSINCTSIKLKITYNLNRER